MDGLRLGGARTPSGTGGTMRDEFKDRIMASLDSFYSKNDPSYRKAKTKAKKKRTKSDIPTEHWEQVQVVNWLRKNGWVYFAVPNGGSRSSAIEGSRMRSEGVCAGVPDLICIAPVQCVIEMKRSKRGRVSEVQKEWLEKFEATGKWACKVAHGHEDAIEFLKGLVE